jgi:hypothetical protein
MVGTLPVRGVAALIAFVLITTACTVPSMLGSPIKTSPTEPPTATATPVSTATPTELERLAAEAGVDPVDLQGAANATGMSPRDYLRSVGELRTPPATSVPVQPKPTARPTATPIPTGFLDVAVDRTVYVVGSRPPVVFRLEVTNDGDVPIDGVEVSVDGPMDKFTVTGVTPGGSYLGRAFNWPLSVPPHDKRSLQITTFANEPGTYAFRLRLRDLAGHEL